MVAGLTLTSASSVAHDLYASVFKRGTASERDEVRVARISAFVIGGIAILLAIPAQKLNIAFLVALAFAVAASANLPSLIYNLFWRRFNTRGATWSIYGGLRLERGAGVLLAGRVRQGGQPGDRREPLAVPGGRGLPLVPAGEPRHSSRSRSGFFLGWLGTVTVRRRSPSARYDELEVRSLTGAGAEKAVSH